MTELVGQAVVGELVVLAVVLVVIGMVSREMARVAIKVLLPVGVVVAVAVWLGLLEQTLVERALASVGSKVMDGVRSMAGWVAATVSSA